MNEYDNNGPLDKVVHYLDTILEKFSFFEPNNRGGKLVSSTQSSERNNNPESFDSQNA